MLLVYFLILTSIFTSSTANFEATASSSTSDAIMKEESNLETYIVLLLKPEGVDFTESKYLESWYQSFMPADTFSSDQPRLIHSYHHVVTGFAAKLTAEAAKAIERKEEVVLARPQRMVTLHTTHTPSFLGLQQNLGLWKQSNYGKGVIIGVVDSGITADHPSFSGEGMPPPPAKWKGKCELNGKLSCNNKLIGARNFDTNSNDLVDRAEHGTHTASTAAGSPVQGVSYFGQANGTAVGVAPLAHLAMYKISGRDDMTGESELLAAMDAAVEDSVDVLSLSCGNGSRLFYDDVIAIAAYAATRKGIFVSVSAGNEGPNYRTLSNEAPWLLTVGASTVDRAIRVTVLLGNNEELNGESLFQPKSFRPKLLRLVYAGANGKTSSVYHVLPASHVSYAAGSAIKAYINSTPSPKATILFKGTVVGLQEAPQVAWFSSRGPSIASPGILKPDIIGPGVRILAAWPHSADNTTNRFEMLSGTSMACPHLSGIAALLKSVHPDWSPEAQLNYPSFSIVLGSSPQRYTRTVTNVGPPHSVYFLEIVAPNGVDIMVTPHKIIFSKVNQKATYSVTFRKNGKGNGSYAQGYLNWVGEGYIVRSPIAIQLK